MGKIRRGGFVFIQWAGDHAPKHVHVYRDGRLICKWDLDHRRVMKGRISKRILTLIQKLEEEGNL
jgi:hypothetical protein